MLSLPAPAPRVESFPGLELTLELAVDLMLDPIDDDLAFDPAGPTLEDRAWKAYQDRLEATLPPPSEPGLPLGEWVAVQASYYRSLGTDAADLVAEAIEGLSRGLRATGARDVATYRDRVDFLDRDDA